MAQFLRRVIHAVETLSGTDSRWALSLPMCMPVGFGFCSSTSRTVSR